MKKIMTGALAAIIMAGGASLAMANTTSNPMVTQLDTVLKQLVTNNTITQDQLTKIEAAVIAAMPKNLGARPQINGAPGGPGFDLAPMMSPNGIFNPNSVARLNVVLNAIGNNETATALRNSLMSGKSIADVAGANTQAVITALVNYDTTQINSQVTAGKLTPQQAQKLIAKLTTKITAQVNAKFPPMGMRHHGPMGAPSTTPNSTSPQQ